MGSMKNTEVELKFKLLNSDELILKLRVIAESVRENDYQKDDYYVPIHRDFLLSKPISEWLRVRETDGKSSINYKNWHHKPGVAAVSCDEIETIVGDSEKIREILDRLNFKKITTVAKSRSTWIYRDVEIAVDKVEELGDFIELEAKGSFETIKDAEEHLYSVAKELGAQFGKQEFKGYPHLLLEAKGLLKDNSKTS